MGAGYPAARSLSPHRDAHTRRLPMFKRIIILCAFAALLPLTVLAQGPVVDSYGLRAGFSTSPDQLVLGGQMSVGEVAPNLSFDPNVELGFGDNVTIIAFNLD